MNGLVDLGADFTVKLFDLQVRANTQFEDSWTDNRRDWCTIEQLIAALPGTTTLTELRVEFEDYSPTPENNRRIVEPLYRCISNLRLQNEHHPLRKLILCGWKTSAYPS